jgi:hypothetical protein
MVREVAIERLLEDGEFLEDLRDITTIQERKGSALRSVGRGQGLSDQVLIERRHEILGPFSGLTKGHS